MELNNIFDLLIDYQDINYQHPPEEDFPSSITHKIDMFIKLLRNGHAFKDSIISFLSKADEDLEPNDVKQAGEFLIYNRGWFWLCLFKPNKQWKLAISDYSNKIELIKYLNLSIKYFESIEEYEKCATLNNIFNIVKDSLD